MGRIPKIVVTTPTGNVGRHVTRPLLQAGVRPTLFLRHPDKLDPETRSLVDLVEGRPARCRRRPPSHRRR